MTNSDNESYLTVEEVANRLKLSPRQAARYAGKVRTRRPGKRILFHAGDVEQLAQELNVEYRPPLAPRSELVPVTEMLSHQRAQEQEIARLSYQIGRLEATIAEREQNQRILTDDLRGQLDQAHQERDQRQAEAARLQQQLESAEAETQHLQAELMQQRQLAIEKQHRPWWKRLLDM